MTHESLRTATKGFSLSLVLVLIVAGAGWLLAQTAMGPNAPSYQVENAQGWAIGIIPSLVLDFGLFWVPLALFGKGGDWPTVIALSLLAAGIFAELVNFLNGYFQWVDWSCFEAEPTHAGFQISRITECPSSKMFFDAFTWVPLLLIVPGSFLAVVQSRRRFGR